MTKRRFHAYCLGPPRSGTHSVARMLAAHFDARHEPARAMTIARLLRWLRGGYTDLEMMTLLKRRDERLCLEMEAAHYLHHVVEILVDQHPTAVFVLTVRDPCSWLESEINQNIMTQRSPVWRALEAYRYGRYGFTFDDDERTLAEIDNVYPIASYLSYWSDHYQRVLRAVPAERLLIVQTSDLRESAAQLAAGLGIDPASIDLTRAHAGRNPARVFDLNAHLRPAYVAGKVRTCCAPQVLERLRQGVVP